VHSGCNRFYNLSSLVIIFHNIKAKLVSHRFYKHSLAGIKREDSKRRPSNAQQLLDMLWTFITPPVRKDVRALPNQQIAY
jgi:hypothetical protein